MPKLRDTPGQRRDKAFCRALSGGVSESGINYKTLSERIGVSNVTVSRWLHGEYRKMSLEHFSQLAKKTGMSGCDVCKILGIPYKEEET